jgi:hypothetical protein
LGFTTMQSFSNAVEFEGRELITSFHKTSLPVAHVAGRWYDMTMTTGSPRSNVYPGSILTATRMYYKSYGAMWGGPPVTPPITKHVSMVQVHSSAATSAPCTWMLCDFLLFYPLIDCDFDGLQTMDNTLAALTRYTNGIGVYAMMVTTSDLGPGVAPFYVKYTNHLGQSGRDVPVVLNNVTASPVSHILHSGTLINNYGPFLPLQAGDLGITKIDSVQWGVGTGGGWAAMVLVKPLLTIAMPTIGVASERSYVTNLVSLPRIYDEAYLGWLRFTGSATPASSVYRGQVEFAWR